MKKRIISLLLSLIMLCSFASMNAFAVAEGDSITAITDEIHDLTDAEKYQKNGIGKVGGYNLSAEEIQELVDLSDIITNSAIVEGATGADGAYLNSYAGLAKGFYKVEKGAFETITTVKDGDNWYIKWDTTPAGTEIDVSVTSPKSEFIEYESGSSKQLTESNYSTLKDRLGMPYAITFDFMNWGKSGTYEKGLFDTVRAYINGNKIDTEYDIRVSTDGMLEIFDAATDKWITTDKEIPVDEFVQITIYHTPRGLNGIREVDEKGKCYGDDNTYHVFVDGELVASANAVYSSLVQNYTVGSATVNSGSDYLLQHFYFGRRELSNIAIDDVRIYFGDFVECKHNWSYSHKHDVEASKNVLSCVCEWCGKEENATISHADSVKLDKNAIDTIAGSNVIINTDFSFNEKYSNFNDIAGTSWVAPFEGASKLYFINNATFRYMVVEENAGNQYLKFQAATVNEKDGAPYTGEIKSNEYLAYENSTYEASKIPNHLELLGSAYAVTFDFIYYGEIEWNGIIDNQKSYTNSNFTVAGASYNIKVEKNGNISFYDASAGKYADSVAKLPIGEAVQITIYHTPRGLNGVKDTIYDAASSTYKKTADYDDNTYHAFINGEHIGSYQACAGDGTNWVYEGTHINSVSDYIPYAIRMGLSSTNTGKDFFAMDDYRIYRGKFLECAHSDVVDGVCKYCKETVVASGYHCDICDGIAISAEAVVSAKSVSLGELIDMNLYVKASGSRSGIATLNCGEKTAEFDLAELTPDKNGNYKLSLALNSIEMTKDVTLTIDGGTYTTSIKEYAEELIASDESDSVKALAKALLNYGASAQEYFAIKNNADTLDDILANAGLADADKAVESLTAADLAAYKFSATGMTDDVKFTGATLTFSSKTYMSVYFTASADATVTVNGKAYTKTEDNGQYYVTVTAATPAEAMTAFAFVITDGETVATSNISVFTAVHAALSNIPGDTNLVNLVTAYARYCELAKAYVA